MSEKGKKILKVALTTLVTIVVLGLTFLGGFFVRTLTFSPEERAALYMVDHYKNNYLFEEGNVTDGIASGLFDIYSEFYTKEEYMAVMSSAQGNSYGFGIMYDTTNLLVSVAGNSPAEKAGILAGGIITAIDVGSGKQVVTAEQLSAIIETVPENGLATLYIDYNGVEKSYEIKRSNYLRTYVTYADDSGYYSFNDDVGSMQFVKIAGDVTISSPAVGYIRYASFYGNQIDGLNGSFGQFKKALETFKENSKNHLILDLRNNGGGYLDITENIASLVVPTNNKNGVEVAYALDKNGNRMDFRCTSSTFVDYGITKITVLANNMSASASETLIGAMLDYGAKIDFDIKVIVTGEESEGNGSYGKGILQSTFMHIDGSAMKLTTEKVYWPLSNTCIHGVGINEQTDSRVISHADLGVLEFAQNA